MNETRQSLLVLDGAHELGELSGVESSEERRQRLDAPTPEPLRAVAADVADRVANERVRDEDVLRRDDSVSHAGLREFAPALEQLEELRNFIGIERAGCVDDLVTQLVGGVGAVIQFGG